MLRSNVEKWTWCQKHSEVNAQEGREKKTVDHTLVQNHLWECWNHVSCHKKHHYKDKLYFTKGNNTKGHLYSLNKREVLTANEKLLLERDFYSQKALQGKGMTGKNVGDSSEWNIIERNNLQKRNVYWKGIWEKMNFTGN